MHLLCQAGCVTLDRAFFLLNLSLIEIATSLLQACRRLRGDTGCEHTVSVTLGLRA